MRINIEAIGAVIRVLRERVEVEKSMAVDALLALGRYKERGVARKIAERILHEYLSQWGLVERVGDRYIWVDLYNANRIDMRLHTIQLVEELRRFNIDDLHSYLMDPHTEIKVSDDLIKHLEVEYLDMYKLLNKIMLLSRVKPFNLDYFEDDIKKFLNQLKALLKYVDSGGSFRYRVCSICGPKPGP